MKNKENLQTYNKSCLVMDEVFNLFNLTMDELISKMRSGKMPMYAYVVAETLINGNEVAKSNLIRDWAKISIEKDQKEAELLRSRELDEFSFNVIPTKNCSIKYDTEEQIENINDFKFSKKNTNNINDMEIANLIEIEKHEKEKKRFGNNRSDVVVSF